MAATHYPGLLGLPVEVLQMFPTFLHDIEDYTNFSSSCRKLYAAFQHTAPKTILRLAAADSSTFFRPSPHFLVAATARQVGDWAVGNPARTAVMREAFRDGIDGLFELCLDTCGLTMDDIRRLHRLRTEIINPVTNLIDQWAGPQWQASEDYVPETYTNDCDPHRAFFQIAIYGELFGNRLTAEGGTGFDVATRMDYVLYCIPDDIHQSGRRGPQLDTGPYVPRYKVRHGPGRASPDYTLGPSAEPSPCPVHGIIHQDIEKLPGDQLALRFLLNCDPWRKAWSDLNTFTGPPLKHDWHRGLWELGVLRPQGIEGLGMLLPGGWLKWRHWLMERREEITKLPVVEDPPDLELNMFDSDESLPARVLPDMAEDIWVATGYGFN